jgi:hypothetical protein
VTKLSQIIAVKQGVAAKAKAEETRLFRLLSVPSIFAGLNKSYQPKDEEGDQLPPESTKVQTSVDAILDELANVLTRNFDVTATQETANATAKADVVVDGKAVLKNVPVTYLLFLEKQLVDIGTFVGKIPVLDPAVTWNQDADNGGYRSAPVATTRTKKVMRNWVRAEATDRHPAQVDVFNEDVIVGTWTKIDFSGAVPATRKAELAGRVDALLRAVKFAREEANSTEVTDVEVGSKVFSYLFS